MGSNLPSLCSICGLFYCWQPPSTAMTQEILIFWGMRVGVGSGGGSLGLVERVLLRQRWKYIEFPKQIQMVQVLSVPRIKWWWSFSESGGHWFPFDCVPGTSKCLTDIVFDSHTRPRAHCCWHQGFTDKHAEICEVKCLARRLTLLGFESEALDLLFPAHFKAAHLRLLPWSLPRRCR